MQAKSFWGTNWGTSDSDKCYHIDLYNVLRNVWRRRCPSFSRLTRCFSYILPKICLPVHNLVHKSTMVLFLNAICAFQKKITRRYYYLDILWCQTIGLALSYIECSLVRNVETFVKSQFAYALRDQDIVEWNNTVPNYLKATYSLSLYSWYCI